MYNKIILIGTMVDYPKEIYDPAGNLHMCFSLNVPLPPDSPPTYWGQLPSTQEWMSLF